MAPFERLHVAFSDAIDRQRGGLFPWVPVCLGIGIGVYFALLHEPSVAVWAALSAAASLLAVAAFWNGIAGRPVILALLLIVTGFLMAGFRAQSVGEPVLGYRYYGPVEGRIVAIDRSSSDRVRLTLDRVVLEDMRPERMPTRVRISLQPGMPGTEPVAGKRVAATANLSPPAGPVEPGGFDFQRMSWFQGLGAVGYTRTPLVAQETEAAGFNLARWRNDIAAEVIATLPGPVGAFAAAITTGDRSALAQDSLDALRQSNLAHLLAISGLHMGLLTSFVFGVLRFVMVLSPAVALGWPVKKIAAVGALMAGAVYLALSGGNVATQRAFIMVAVVLMAVLLERRALTMRAVAVAAIIVMVLRPESLSEPGFQMSFAATIALIATFRVIRDFESDRIPRWARPALATVISSFVAGAATAPVAASHFNMIAHYGLIANLVSVPLMGLIVMPGAVLAACLAPFGLHWIGLAMMEPAIHWILFVAHWISAQDGAVGRVVSPGLYEVPLFALGMLWLILWRGRARFAGLVPAVAAFAIWGMVERPLMLVSPGGGLIGLMTDGGRVLNKPKGEGFSAQSWLENDGDVPDQEAAAARPGLGESAQMLAFDVGATPVAYLSGRGAVDRVGDGCAVATMVILSAKASVPAPAGCQVFDQTMLTRTGGMAIYRDGEKIRIVTVQDFAGQRPWNSAAARFWPR